MANPPFEQISFIPTLNAGIPPAPVTPVPGAVKRPFGDWAGDVLNVRNFGALGDGSHNDTPNIQAAINAAGIGVGSIGETNQSGVRPIYIPRGHYNIQAPVAPLVPSAVVQNGSGTITYTVSSTVGYSNGATVFVCGITGGDAYNGTKVVNLGDNVGANTGTKLTTIGAWPLVAPGTVVADSRILSAALLITRAVGAKFYGDGKYASQLFMQNTGVPILTNGCRDSTFENFTVSGPGITYPNLGMVVDMDPYWGAAQSPTTQGVHDNTFHDMIFQSFYTGIYLAPSFNSQGDTMSLYDCCFFSNRHGLNIGAFGNGNAVNINVYGGDFQGNIGLAINCAAGTLGVVAGVNFENAAINQPNFFCVWIGGGTGTSDASSGNSAGLGTPTFIDCNTEDANFIFCGFGLPTVIGCQQRGSTNGAFLTSQYGAIIDGSFSITGQVALVNGGSIKNSQFLRTDAIIKDASYLLPVFVENVMIGGSAGSGVSSAAIPTHLKGFFINSAVPNQYFVGQRIPVTFAGTGPSTSTTTLKVADLPPASIVYVQGITVTVFDCDTTTAGTFIGVGESPTHGGGANIVLVKNNGAHWVIM